MSARTALTPTITAAALAASALLGAGAANAEAVVYKTRNVEAVSPDGGVEHAAIEIPTGYTRHKASWHKWYWYDDDNGLTVALDLQPRRDTVKELEAERSTFMEEFGEGYEELEFTVNGKDARVRARWVFTHFEANTGNVDPYTSVVLMRGGNRILVAGSLPEQDLADRIRRHVVRTISFPG
ncbi:MAG TPA: hypothetical protein VFR87_00230 [Nocardioidaceae bacterium]|nr:hypothetical protein [Nocardioidaceae bacterium]